MYSTVRVIRNIIYAAVSKGADLNHLCRVVGISQADLHEADKKIEGVTPLINLWTEVLAATGDPLFGLHTGQANTPAVMGALGYLMQSCGTMEETYQAVAQYQQTVSAWISYEYKAGANFEVILGMNPLWRQTSPETARQAIEMAAAGAINYIHLFTGRHIYPIAVEFGFKSPAWYKEFELIFKCPVSFDMPQNRLIFEGTLGQIPLISADNSLYLSFAKLLSDQCIASHQIARFSERVKVVIARDFGGRSPSLEVIAAHMNVSDRSFQRHLQQDGKTYRSLSAEIKRELAISLLRNTDATVDTISEVLGYKEPSAFHKAFKNWTKTSPGKKKQSLSGSEK